MKKLLLTIFALCLPVAALAQDKPKDAGDKPKDAHGVVRVESPEVASEAKSVEEKSSQLLHGAEKVIEGAKGYADSPEGEKVAVDTSKSVLTLSAKSCAEMAVRQNPTALVAQDEVDAVEAKIGQVMAQWKPQVSAKTAFRHTEFKSTPSSPLTKLFVGNLQPGQNTFTEQVTLKQTFYAGGQISAAVKASEFLAQSQAWQRDATLDALEFQAKQAYQDCVLADALVVVAEESVVTFKRHLSDAQQMFDVGMISGYEVLRAKTELGTRQSGLVAAKNAVLLAQANLRKVVSIPQDQPIVLKDEMEWIPVTASMDEHVRFAYEHRPELLALEKGIAASKQDIRRVKGEYLPQVAGTIDYTNTANGGAAVSDGWTMSLGAQIDIYAGGKRKHEMVESKARSSKLEHQVADIKRLIELDIRQSRIQVDNAISQIKTEQGNVELGKEGLRLAQLRFQEGVGTQSETLDADLALTSAESKLAQALRDYAVAHAALDKALGTGALRESSKSDAAKP